MRISPGKNQAKSNPVGSGGGRAGATAGSAVDRPRWARILATTGESSMVAMKRRRPPQLAHANTSRANTLLIKSADAQARRVRAALGDGGGAPGDVGIIGTACAQGRRVGSGRCRGWGYRRCRGRDERRRNLRRGRPGERWVDGRRTRRAPLRARGQDAMVQDQIDVRSLGYGRQAFQGFVRGKDQVARAVVPGASARGSVVRSAALSAASTPRRRKRRKMRVPTAASRRATSRSVGGGARSKRVVPSGAVAKTPSRTRV